MAPKRIRRPANMDDDEDVERYKDQLQQREDEKEEAKEIKRHKGKSDHTVVNGIIANVAQIVKNLDNGDSPVTTASNAYLFVAQPGKLTKPEAVVVLVFYTPGQEMESADMKIFKSLSADEDMCAISEDLMSLESSHSTVASAMPALVDFGVSQELVPAKESARLKSLFQVWMHGVKWNKMHMSSTNRPSLASWDGWPTDVFCILNRSLLRGVKDKNVIAPMDRGTLETSMDPSSHKNFKKIWSASGELANTDVEDVIRLAIEEAVNAKA